MWAQLITARIKPERQADIEAVQEELERRSRDGSTGWLRTIALQNQNDPEEHYMLVFFESEEKARENERSPEQQEMVQRFSDMFDGSPSFVDLNPVYDRSR